MFPVKDTINKNDIPIAGSGFNGNKSLLQNSDNSASSTNSGEPIRMMPEKNPNGMENAGVSEGAIQMERISDTHSSIQPQEEDKEDIQMKPEESLVVYRMHSDDAEQLETHPVVSGE